MNTCPKCGSPQVEEHTNYAKETDRTWWVCGTFQTRDCHPHHSELCLEREEKNTLQRKVEELQVAQDFANEAIDQRERSRFYFKGYWYQEYLELREKWWKQIGENSKQAERIRELEEQIQAKLDDLQASTIHSCGDSCSRPMCVLRRERDAYKEALQMCVFWAESVSRRVTEDRDSINWTGLQIARKALADIQKEAK